MAENGRTMQEAIDANRCADGTLDFLGIWQEVWPGDRENKQVQDILTTIGDWPIKSRQVAVVIVAMLHAAATAQAVPAAGAETPRCRIDPMQNPFRPGYYMNYQQGETPAESVLRKLACWLGAGGYNDEKLDADLMHRKIVAAIQDLAAAPAAPAPEAAAKDHRQWLLDKYETGPGEFWGGHP